MIIGAINTDELDKLQNAFSCEQPNSAVMAYLDKVLKHELIAFAWLQYCENENNRLNNYEG